MLIIILIMLLFVAENHLVIAGATYGLMLWYQCIIPTLLPFMLISGIFINRFSSTSMYGHSDKSTKMILCTVFLGVLCGYPIGAKTNADFISKKGYDSAIGNIIMPLANNSSPMFISGYVAHIILRDTIPFVKILLLIYIPYILLTGLMLCIYHCIKKRKSLNSESFIQEASKKNIQTRNQEHTSREKSGVNSTSTDDNMLKSVIQITYVGIYIIICSIIVEFINNLPYDIPLIKSLAAGFVEITRGLKALEGITFLSYKIKTALIIAATSFGGISAILQTNKVIQDTGLSILFYTIIKLCCAMATFGLTLLFI
ncbi:MAG: hypothetical protein ACI4D8_06580 [Wujia sp.]